MSNIDVREKMSDTTETEKSKGKVRSVKSDNTRIIMKWKRVVGVILMVVPKKDMSYDAIQNA